MKLNTMCTLCAFTLAAPTFRSAAQQTQEANPCVTVFRDAMVRKVGIINKGNFNSDFKSYLLSETFRKDLRSGKWGGSLTIPIKGVPISLGVNHSDGEYHEFREKILNWDTASVQWDFFQSLSASFPDTQMAAEFNKCLEVLIPKEGFSVRTEPGVEKFVNSRFLYRKAFEMNPTPVVKDIKIVGGKLIQCDFKIGKKVGEETVVLIEREADSELIFSVQTSKDAVTYKLPAKSPERIRWEQETNAYASALREYQMAEKVWQDSNVQYLRRLSEVSRVTSAGQGGKDGGSPTQSRPQTPPPGSHIVEVYGECGGRLNAIGYKATLPDGRVFDSGLSEHTKGGSPFRFVIAGNDRLIKLVTHHGSNEGLESIEIFTDRGEHKKFGGNGHVFENLQSPGGEIVNIVVTKSGTVVNLLSAESRALVYDWPAPPAKPVLGKSDPGPFMAASK